MNDDRRQSEEVRDDPLRAVPSQLTATAYHEAGHAVMAMSLGRPIHKVTIAPGRSKVGGIRLGVCEIRKGSKASKDQLEDEVLILLAGMVAEAHFTGDHCRASASQDLRDARRILQHRATNERQLERLERRLLEKTEHLLRSEAQALAITLVADELISKTTISGRAVRHFVKQAEAQTNA